MPRPSVAIVTPIYKPKPSNIDDISLHRRLEVLGDYATYHIAPSTLDVSEYRKYGDAKTLTFSPDFFTNGVSYSRLLLREDFYARFRDHEYVLIYQTDAFAFRDALEEFCATPYHYFGAAFDPGHAWPTYSFRGVGHLINRFPALLPREKVLVGNGGFSLRNVEATIDLLQKDWLASRTYRGQEDLYFSTRANTRWKERFRICDVDTARRFAIDEKPREALERLGGDLPFGVHAWQKVDPDLWRPVFADLGYEF